MPGHINAVTQCLTQHWVQLALMFSNMNPPCREYFGETYAQLAQGLFAEHPGSFPADTFTADAFKWAAVIVRSRSHAPLEGDDLALVPLADLVCPATIQ